MYKYKVQSKISLSGFLHKEPKIKSDGSAELLLKVPVYDKVTRKGKEIESKILYSAFYYVYVPCELWEKLKHVNNFSYFNISGKVSCSVTKKGSPVIIVYCEYITISNLPKDDKTEYLIEYLGKKQEIKIKNNDEVVEYKTRKVIKTPEEPKYIWTYDTENLESIEVSSIILTEEEHLKNSNSKGFYLANRGELAPVVIRRIENSDKYSLVLGFGTYSMAKIFNINSVKALTTDLSRDEFELKYKKYIEIRKDND